MRPSILGFFTVGMTTLSMLSVICVLYSAGSGVKRVLVVASSGSLALLIMLWLGTTSKPV